MTETMDAREDRTMPPIVLAFLVSMIAHVCLFGFIEAGNRLNLWRFSPLALLAQALNLNSIKSAAASIPNVKVERKAAPKTETIEEMPVIFVDVDPAQASKQDPDRTKFTSSVSTLAGNPDTSVETATPKFDGKQDKVLKTRDTQRAATPAVPQPSPPVPRRPEVAQSEKAQTETPPAAKTQLAKLTPAAQPQTPPLRGDRETYRPSPATTPEEAGLNAQKQTQPPQHERPRTVAAARAQKMLNPNSAMIGEKMKQDGGIKRFSVEPSLSVKGTPLGNYQSKLAEIVQRCWYELLDEQRFTLDVSGKVELKFKLYNDGRVADWETVYSNVGEIYTAICQLAITKPAPFEKWPEDLRRLQRDNFLRITFTFYY